ncbi:Neurotransmitter-gated ion-channel ligand binding domain protein [Trichostrongylus colubriformis]|uniref:Neurotransmitter-gated ion-channel ligand binding domain protein n=1 Tax=Trichostrongylus colubriformis TaxID=6319 RepID=A0AAN8F1L8_TRICO
MLLSTYNRELRPPGSTTHISINLRFFSLLYMQQQEENMVFSGDFEMSWTDASLKWAPSDYQGLKHTNVYEKDIWTPEITVYNSVGQEPVIGNDRRLATVTHEGLVQISNPSIYTVRCKLDIGKFPFDQQQCTVKFSSWVYTADELAVSALSEDLDLTNGEYQGNSEWEVTSVTVSTLLTTDQENQTFQELHYSVKLKRHSAYYVYVLFLPTFITTALCLVGLFTPFNNAGERAERTTLGLTTLLSLAVILNIIGDGMPKSSTLPQLASFVLAEILLCCIGVLVSVILLVAHQRILTRQLILPFGQVERKWKKTQAFEEDDLVETLGLK